MPHKKRRTEQNIMEEHSLAIVRNKLPKEWVIHQYAPDYGIDFVVETFEYIDGAHKMAETLGEFFFVQLKSVQKTNQIILQVKARLNVELYAQPYYDEKINIEVIRYPIDVDLLFTVLSMGTSVPVVLFLADLSTENLYFLCLNDYIEKILIPEGTKLSNSSTVTLYIPISNKVDTDPCLCHLSFLARRSKLIGAFNKFNYQQHKLDKSPETMLHFISIIKNYDFWQAKVVWPALIDMYDEMLKIEKFLSSDDIHEKLTTFREKSRTEYENKFGPLDVYPPFIHLFWDKLCNLSRIYEEVCKEWFLPTYFWCNTYKSE